MKNSADSLETLRETVALSCRILAMEGLADSILGHVSARIPGTDEMLIRCRGREEEGVRYTQAEAVRRVDFDGNGDDLQGKYKVPIELAIHGEIYKKRPDVGCVIHAHPPAALVCGLSELAIRPVFGAYNPAAMRMALDGVPVFPHSYLVSRPALAAPLLETMQSKDVCLMKGHGVTVTGRTVEEATIRAIDLHTLFQVIVECAKAGGTPEPISQEDIEELPRPGKHSLSGENWFWRHYVRKLKEMEK